MKTHRLWNILFSIFVVASMLLATTTQVSAKTPTPPAPKPPAHIHQGKITPAERQAAAQRAAIARAASAELGAQAAYAPIPGEADYFGTTPNYAISPIPASVSIFGDGLGAIYTPVLTGGTVTSFVLAVPATLTTPGSVGSGYTPAATTIEVIGGGHSVDGLGRTGCIGTPTFSVAPFTALNPSGAITAITPSGTCSGFDATHGIRKFVDSLPMLNTPNTLGNQMTVAVPTTMTINGVDSDFYEIHLKDFPWVFNSSLPATTVRGYFQVLNGTPVAYSYLGPVIVAQQNRPVRIKFVNELPLGSGGNLFIPVDTTVMGAGMGPTGAMYTQARAELHLHGGVTPWISDGTPHQWTTPTGSTTANTAYPEGVSVVNVPDMDSGNEPIGTLTYYYTNQQSARLMFYHDHAFGITRLNVYAGEAAGYFVQDNFEHMLATGKALDNSTTTLTGTGAAATATMVGGAVTAITLNTVTVAGKVSVLAGANYTAEPSVSFTGGGTPTRAASAVAYMSAGKVTSFAILDGGAGYTSAPTVVFGTTTFTATAGTIPGGNIPLVIQDRTFVDTNDIQRTDPTWALKGGPMTQGGLWYPHVYMPNQNPADMLGVNNMGRWDWGPWFWPPAPVQFPALPNPYAIDAGLNPSEGPTIPSTPNPSIVPEGYMDTPIINGTAYPTLTVAPTAVRFRILNASNDRYMNLSLFCAASQAPGPMWTGTALNDGLQGEVKMVPAAPGMGLPALWPTDGRDGGVPDPAAAGPDFIQIGTEGGFLPAVAHRPAQPVGYEYNRRSITVLNVLSKGLYLGPAERADVIVDFSKAPAGCTRLILYNDAPAPMPAFDPRNDYYTNDADNTSTGGAPSTQLGYGPNTRTLMQINISGATAAFNEAPLDAALPVVFAATQDKPIVPQPPFNAAMVYAAPTTNYARIGDMSMSFFNGPVNKVNLLAGGKNYSTAAVSITGGGGVGAQASAVIAPVILTGLSPAPLNGNNPGSGSGYTSAPTVKFTGGGGAGAAGTATFTRTVSKITVTAAGSGYTTSTGPTVVFSNLGTGLVPHATCNMVQTNPGLTPALYKVGSVSVTWGGSGYGTTAPLISFNTGGLPGSGAKATAALTGVVNSVTLTNPGSGYTSPPSVTLTGGGGTGAGVAVAYDANVITAIKVDNVGANYISAPTVTITGPGAGASAVAVGVNVPFGPKAIQELWDLDYGRMNATLGVEIPNTTGVNQTTIPYGANDPATEILQYSNPAVQIGDLGDGTQLWKITHNGVDSHPVHFHMFNVQVLNRVGWDGMIKPINNNEVGWKDTFIMNPLEDVVVAIRAIKPDLPWELPNSVRPLAPAMPIGSVIQGIGQDPTGLPVTILNQIANFGWEYTWHCHILGHEENDFMRPMLFAVPPVAPTTLVFPTISTTSLTVRFTDASVNETGFVIQRAPSVAGQPGAWTTLTTIAVVPGSAASKGTTAIISYSSTGLKTKTMYFYRVMAINAVGSGVTNFPMVTANSPFLGPLSVTTK